MKASELRIGNLVNYTNGGIFKVIGIHDFGLDVEDEIEITYMELENFEPIPLTEEWLVKLGFTKGLLFDTILYLSGTRWHISYHNGIYQLNYKESTSSQWIPVLKNLKHVHTLQNLYFALTGQELTIKTNESNQRNIN